VTLPVKRIRPPETVPLTDVLAALSFALDLTEGQPMGHALRTDLISMELAARLDLPLQMRRDLYYAALLKDAGCSSNAAAVFDIRHHDIAMARIITDRTSCQGCTRWSTPPWRPVERAKRVATLPGTARAAARRVQALRAWRRHRQSIGRGPPSRAHAEDIRRHGHPLKGEQIPLRRATVAHLEVFAPAAACTLWRCRRAARWSTDRGRVDGSSRCARRAAMTTNARRVSAEPRRCCAGTPRASAVALLHGGRQVPSTVLEGVVDVSGPWHLVGGVPRAHRPLATDLGKPSVPNSILDAWRAGPAEWRSACALYIEHLDTRRVRGPARRFASRAHDGLAIAAAWRPRRTLRWPWLTCRRYGARSSPALSPAETDEAMARAPAATATPRASTRGRAGEDSEAQAA
jgi:hypothetical protein